MESNESDTSRNMDQCELIYQNGINRGIMYDIAKNKQ